MGIDKPTAQAVPVKTTDQYQVSVRKAARHGGDFIVIDPQAACLEETALSLFQIYYRMFHLYLLFPLFQ